MKRVLTAFVFVALIASTAMAWTEYSDGQFYDEGTVRRAGNKVSVQHKSDLGKYGVRKSLIVFDCERGTYTDEAYDVAPIGGEVLRSPVKAKLFDLLCTKSKAKK